MSVTPPVYILGWAQTDFARHMGREGVGPYAAMAEVARDAVEHAALSPEDIETGHVGNFTGELFNEQGQLGGMLASAFPEWHGLPTARHEAACASGSVAIQAATAELLSGRYETALVVGIELMRHVGASDAARFLGTAAWHGEEAQGARFLWPFMFSELADEIDRRHGLDDAYLRQWSTLMFANAKRNPRAQSRNWTFEAPIRAEDATNPVVEGRLRKLDCGRITDGAAALVLATPSYAARHAARQGKSLEQLVTIAGWGHRTATMRMRDKLKRSADAPLIFPHVAVCADEARQRAGLGSVSDIDAFEVHDCFSVTGYMLVDHLGITPAGRAFEAFDAGAIELEGTAPMNPSGGLIGLGHPVGATGVRMVVDAARQVSGVAGEYQVEGANWVQTLNLGGSATTVVSYVVGRRDES